MDLLTNIVILLLALSLLVNVWLIVYAKKIVPKKSALTVDAQMLLRDLMNGPALLKVDYLDRADVLLRSPRHFS